MDNKQISRNCFIIILCHLTKVWSQINKCIIFEHNKLSITLSTLWSTIRGFSSSSALWDLEVLCFMFCHSFSLIGHSTSWWMVVAENWLTWCQEYPREVFWVWSAPCVHSRALLNGYDDDSTFLAVVTSPGERVSSFPVNPIYSGWNCAEGESMGLLMEPCFNGRVVWC